MDLIIHFLFIILKKCELFGELNELGLGNKFLDSMNNFIGISGELVNSYNYIKEAILFKVQNINHNLRKLIKEDTLVNEIKKCFKINNHNDYITAIRSLIGF
jgi:hypothetical protein